jgi:hypothetical protein
VEGNDRDREREERRNTVRLRDHLHVARRKAQEARATAAELEEQARTVVGERERLEGRARELVSTLRERPRLAKEAGEQVGPGLSGIAEWATNARAALLVARTQLAGERDAVIRQANELAAVVVGEPIAGGTAVVARRVESALGAHD